MISLERDDVARTELVTDPEAAAEQLRDFETSREIAELLLRYYPDWPWAVTARWRYGICNVFNFELSGKIGFRLMLDRDGDGPSAMRRAAIQAGGEMLEAYGQRRGRMPAGGAGITAAQFHANRLPGGERVRA